MEKCVAQQDQEFCGYRRIHSGNIRRFVHPGRHAGRIFQHRRLCNRGVPDCVPVDHVVHDPGRSGRPCRPYDRYADRVRCRVRQSTVAPTASCHGSVQSTRKRSKRKTFASRAVTLASASIRRCCGLLPTDSPNPKENGARSIERASNPLSIRDPIGCRRESERALPAPVRACLRVTLRTFAQPTPDYRTEPHSEPLALCTGISERNTQSQSGEETPKFLFGSRK